MNLENTGVLSVLSLWIFAAKADIESVVFVHPIFGSPTRSWQAENGIFWPRNFLAQDHQYARVWTFNWNYKMGLSLSTIANNLGVALSHSIDNRRLEGDNWSDMREVGSSGSHRSITLTAYCVHKGRCSSSACVRMRWFWWNCCEKGMSS